MESVNEDVIDYSKRVTRRSSTDRSLGSILLAAGRLTPENLERINQRQNETSEQFGEAARSLGLISEDDLSFALVKQFEYPFPVLRDSGIGKAVNAAHRPFSPQIEALRGVRSRLLLNWLNRGSQDGKALAVVSPARGEGRSWLTANLAVLFSQIGESTLIVDADMRNPCQHLMFGLSNQQGLSGVIAGVSGLNAIQQIKDFPNLSILTAGVIPPNPQELVSRIEFPHLMGHLRQRFDIILIDTPALSEVADAETIAYVAGHAVFVAKRNKSKMALLDNYCAVLNQLSVQLAGSVMLS